MLPTWGLLLDLATFFLVLRKLMCDDAITMQMSVLWYLVTFKLALATVFGTELANLETASLILFKGRNKNLPTNTF